MKINRVDYNNNNTPVLYDREIDEFAHNVLEDYKPNLLKEPGAIRFEHFLESYLGVNLMYKDIYNPDPEKLEVFAKFINLTEEETARMYDLASYENGEIPSDLDDIFMYEEVGSMARFALRQTKAGNATEEDWKKFIREIEANKKRRESGE